MGDTAEVGLQPGGMGTAKARPASLNPNQMVFRLETFRCYTHTQIDGIVVCWILCLGKRRAF